MRWSVRRLLTPLAVAVTLYSMQADAVPVQPTATVVVRTYADLAAATYGESLKKAKALKAAVDALIAKPSSATLAAARAAWRAARVPYAQSEGFRFGNPIVDEWEPRVNSWPVDEGLIDYVAPSYGKTSDENPLYTLNVVAHPRIRIGAKQVDATRIDKVLLRQLQNAQGVDANVATGYHAIEFLLWGQDLHGTGPGAGERPYTDYDLKHCTHGNCDRRAAYLHAATDLLVADLVEMAAAWGPLGKARLWLLAKPANEGLAVILTGLGSLSYGELAGERMKLGLILHDPEEEQDCFSDNTINEHYENVAGIYEIWSGRGASYLMPLRFAAFLRDYVMEAAPEAAKRLDAAMLVTLDRLSVLDAVAKGGLGDHALITHDVMDAITTHRGRMAYDQMIGPNNPAGNKLVQDAIDALVAQTHAIEGVVAALHLRVQLRDRDKFENAGR